MNYKKIDFFINHPSMFINPECFDSVVAFIDGINFGADENFSNKIKEWLLVRYNITESPFHWGKLIINNNYSNENDLNFLYQELKDFLNIVPHG